MLVTPNHFDLPPRPMCLAMGELVTDISESPDSVSLYLITTMMSSNYLYIHHEFWHKCHYCRQCFSMMTSSSGNIFRVTGHLCGEFPGPGEFPTQRPVTRSFGVFCDLPLNKRLSKQLWGWWFEMPSRSLWRQCNGDVWHHNESCSPTAYSDLRLHHRKKCTVKPLI